MNRKKLQQETAMELVLYAVNCEPLYDTRICPLIRKLRTRRDLAGYDPNQAVRAWAPVARAAARWYQNRFPGAEYSRHMTRAVQGAAAEELEKFFREDVLCPDPYGREESV